jgi:hypothetical protein
VLASTAIEKPDERVVFALEGAGFRGWVVAGVAVTVEDEGEYCEASPLLAED